VSQAPQPALPFIATPASVANYLDDAIAQQRCHVASAETNVLMQRSHLEHLLLMRQMLDVSPLLRTN
jgi:hypothetical protein